MQPTSIMCRTQEARHHAIAVSATLANSKGIAMIAAAAWAKEAVAAEKRETRLIRVKLTRDADALPLALSASEDRSLSENPDRGFADDGLSAR